MAKEHAGSLTKEKRFIDELGFAVMMAMYEVLVNHIKHGHQRDETKIVNVEARVISEDDQQMIVFESEDQGAGFDPSEVPDFTDEANLGKETGRGLGMMNLYTKKHGGTVQYLGNGNRVRLSFVLTPVPVSAV